MKRLLTVILVLVMILTSGIPVAAKEDLNTNVNWLSIPADFNAGSVTAYYNRDLDQFAIHFYLSDLDDYNKENRYYLIDHQTWETVSISDYDFVYPFSDDLALVEKSEWEMFVGETVEYGYIDKTGKIVVPLTNYDFAESFSEGLALVCNGDKYGFIDKTGKVIIPFIYDYAESFSDGLALVGNEDGEFGFIDKTGKVVIPFEYNSAESFSDGLALVENEDWEYGFIDKTGKVIIPFEYNEAYSFSDGLALVGNEDWEFGFIDKTGKVVIPFEYDGAYSFSNGACWTWKESDESVIGYRIDKSGKVIGTLDFLDSYIPVETYFRGRPVTLSNGCQITNENGDTCGYVDGNGQIAIPVEYDYCEAIHNGTGSPPFFLVIKGSSVGIVENPNYTESDDGGRSAGFYVALGVVLAIAVIGVVLAQRGKKDRA